VTDTVNNDRNFTVSDPVMPAFDPDRLAVRQRVGNFPPGRDYETVKCRLRDLHKSSAFVLPEPFKILEPDCLEFINGENCLFRLRIFCCCRPE